MSGLIFVAFVVTFLLIVGLFAYLPTVLFCILIPTIAYCVRAWHPLAIAVLFSVYAGIPYFLWHQAGIATERAENAYQANINALPRLQLPADLPDTVLVKTQHDVTVQDFHNLSCGMKVHPGENDSRELTLSPTTPARYLLLDLSPDNPLPEPGRRPQGRDGPFALFLVEAERRTLIRYHLKVHFGRPTFPPILSMWGWARERNIIRDHDPLVDNAVIFMRDTLGRCADFALYKM
ncbi:hypothetical protein [Rhizobium sp. Rhizsp82]|uniref:hypothetical protein n=1 Tax=Rhizobium sp. Rhizsp82 TaxID=3243057 RepID=UPI0039B61EB8